MTRKEFNSLVRELEGIPFVTIRKDTSAPKYMGVEVSKDGVVYNYSIISVNDAYKAKKCLISRILDISRSLDSEHASKKA